MKGGMTESQAGCTIWDDVSKETFERLAQFAYTGDYSVPKMEKRKKAAKKQKALTNGSSPSASNGIRSWDKAEELSQGVVVKQYDELVAGNTPALVERYYEPVAEHPPVAVDDEWGSFSKSRKDEKKNRNEYHFLSFPLLAPRNNHENSCEPDEHFDRDRSYSNVFLCHASLYVLADFQLIDSLKALALFKLHKTLCVFQLDDDNAEDLIDLAMYAYSEEGGGRGFDEGFGPLRSLVCQYIAMNALTLSLDDGFMDLLGEGGQFVKDFFKFVV